MKRKTIEFIRTDISDRLAPLAKRLAVSPFPRKRPRLKSEWLEWHTELSDAVAMFNPPSMFPTYPNIIYAISSFLIPSKGVDFNDFLHALHKTLVLRQVSKGLRRQTSVFLLARMAFDASFAPQLRPAQYQYLLSCRSDAQSFLAALDMLEGRFMSKFDKWPHARVFRGNAVKLWGMTHEDLAWAQVEFVPDSWHTRSGESCDKSELSWAAMCCHSPEDVEAKAFYCLLPHHIAALEQQEQHARAIQAAQRRREEAKAQIKRVGLALRELTRWPARFFNRTPTFRRYSMNEDINNWLTGATKAAIAKEMLQSILANEFDEQLEQLDVLKHKDHRWRKLLRGDTFECTESTECWIRDEQIQWSLDELGLLPGGEFIGERSLNRWRDQIEYQEFVNYFKECRDTLEASIALLARRFEWRSHASRCADKVVRMLFPGFNRQNQRRVSRAMAEHFHRFAEQSMETLEGLGLTWVKEGGSALVQRISKKQEELKTPVDVRCICGQIAARTCDNGLCGTCCRGRGVCARHRQR